jgi:hypothetical protein
MIGRNSLIRLTGSNRAMRAIINVLKMTSLVITRI